MQNYPDNINPAAYSIVKHHITNAAVSGTPPISGSHIFVEFGCSTGALGYALLKEYPGISWIGLDYNSAALKVAKTRLNQVYQLDFNRLNKDSLGDITPNPSLLIMVDVLEHVYEPVNFVQTVASAFPSASILCVLPNIACYQSYERLSCNDFPYDESGIFDKTHRTFYTPISAKKMYARLGYYPSLGPVYLPDPKESVLLEQDISFPYIFSRRSYSVRIETREHLASLCSYGFAFIFSPLIR